MSGIFVTYIRTRNISELADIYQMFLSQKAKQNVIVTNKNGKYEFTDNLPNE